MKRQKETKEPVPAWRMRLVSVLNHPKVPAEVKADVRSALDEIDHLRDVIAKLGDK